MDVISDKVAGNRQVGERKSRPNWSARISDEYYDDYESMFKSFVSKMLDNRGSFKVNGDLFFEFVPKAYMSNENLISAETSFFFHQYEEGSFVQKTPANNDSKEHLRTAQSYNYQKNVPPLDEKVSSAASPNV